MTGERCEKESEKGGKDVKVGFPAKGLGKGAMGRPTQG